MAGQEGFEPPTPGFGVRCSAVRATGLFQVSGSESRVPGSSTGHSALGTDLLCFLVGSVLAAPTTVFLQFDPVGRILLILGRGVISSLALTAG